MARLGQNVGASLWIPDTAAEFEEAVVDGRLREDHFHDLKRELGRGAKGNLDLAIDLASFSVDGGLILLGANESPTETKPLALAGIREKIDQVARSRPDPPLWVEVRELSLEGQESDGYIVIVVPPSPDAPHQVAGKYRGRSDTTNTVLSDSDVRRIRAEREAGSVDLTSELEAWQARDPVPPPERVNAHVYVVAVPTYRRSAMAVDALGRAASSRIGALVRQAPSASSYWSPMLHSTHEFRPTPEGWSWWRKDRDEDGVVGVEVTDTCTIRYVGMRAAILLRDQRIAVEGVIGGAVLETVDLARRLGLEVGYLGNWDFAMEVVGLEGAVSAYLHERLDGQPFPYESDTYVAATSTTHVELNDSPNSVIRRLTTRLNRALNGDVDDAMPRLT